MTNKERFDSQSFEALWYGLTLTGRLSSGEKVLLISNPCQSESVCACLLSFAGDYDALCETDHVLHSCLEHTASV